MTTFNTQSKPLPAPDWIAVDWGTSNIRVWAMSDSGSVLAEISSNQGMNSLSASEFESVLVSLIAPWLPERDHIIVLACGMVGAKQGWIETDYRTVPCSPVATGSLIEAPVSDSRMRCFILSGLKQNQPSDVMRGEECQIAGFLMEQPDYHGALCLPGTHSKWVQVRGGEVQGFTTFMTGELFELLSTQSVLRHSLNKSIKNKAGSIEFSNKAFVRGVKVARDKPVSLLSQLFSIRADSILHNCCAIDAHAFLSGVLIGSELMASKDYWQDQNVILIGSDHLSSLYEKSISLMGGFSQTKNVVEMTLAGLYTLWQKEKQVLNG